MSHTSKKKIRFNTLQMCSPSQVAAGLWTHPQDNGVDYTKIAYWTDMARLIERGLFDGLFIAEPFGVMDVYRNSPEPLLRSGGSAPSNDPAMVISAMAAVTKHLCFSITGNVSYEHPFMLARRMATLDHLTGGRVALNVVTGAMEAGAKAVGKTLRPHDERYDLADDYMEACYKLWEGSWADNAVVADRQSRTYARPGSVRKVRHDGPEFSYDAVFVCEPSPQRTPVIYQAGSSPRGRRFAAQHAEVVFLSGQKAAIPAQIADIRHHAEAAGRDPSKIITMVAATVFVGRTEAEAIEMQREAEAALDIEGSLAILSGFMGQDLSKYAPDEPLRAIENNAFRALTTLLMAQNPGKEVLLRDLVRVGSATAKDAIIVGSPEQVADKLIAWIEETGIDGFNLSRLVEPCGLTAIVDLLVPVLQERGYYKTAYAEGTFRDQLFGAGPRVASHHPASRHRWTL